MSSRRTKQGRDRRAGRGRCTRGLAARTTAEGTHAVELQEGADVDAFLKAALAGGARVLAVSPRRESLEEFFIRQAQAGGQPKALT